mmetsp:Transcript_42746/g.90872  ORF Transcript_42746/g.90872 Transcript_42746/m.90872 type:complete len:374 (+) Transcript_42746:406-1527(+)
MPDPPHSDVLEARHRRRRGSDDAQAGPTAQGRGEGRGQSDWVPGRDAGGARGSFEEGPSKEEWRRRIFIRKTQRRCRLGETTTNTTERSRAGRGRPLPLGRRRHLAGADPAALRPDPAADVVDRRPPQGLPQNIAPHPPRSHRVRLRGRDQGVPGPRHGVRDSHLPGLRPLRRRRTQQKGQGEEEEAAANIPLQRGMSHHQDPLPALRRAMERQGRGQPGLVLQRHDAGAQVLPLRDVPPEVRVHDRATPLSALPQAVLVLARGLPPQDHVLVGEVQSAVRILPASHVGPDVAESEGGDTLGEGRGGAEDGGAETTGGTGRARGGGGRRRGAEGVRGGAGGRVSQVRRRLRGVTRGGHHCRSPPDELQRRGVS